MNFIETPTITEIEHFFRLNEKNQKTFRYFKKRNFDVIKSHIKTLLLCDSDNILGYGHLDSQDNKIWLGVMVCDDCVGKGFGNIIMKKLLENINNDIFLSVDKINLSAINLYKKNNFITIDEYDNYFLMKRSINL